MPRQKANEKTQNVKKKEKEVLAYTQDFIPLKNIRNGLIETTDGRYLKIVEVEPINFTLRSEEEKANIIWSFASWLKIANVNLQMMSITRKADAEKHIELLQQDMRDETNPQTRELARAYINLIREVGSNEALTRRFFIIIEYEPYQGRIGDYQEICQTMQSAAQQIKKYLSQCGNNVIVPKKEDVFLGEVLYMYFNRKSSEEESFANRVRRVTNDWMLNKGLDPRYDQPPAIPPINFIAPRGLDLTHARYTVMDGMYYTYLYVRCDGFPRQVQAGWLNQIVNAGEGIDVNVFFKRMPKTEIMDKVALRIRLNSVKLNHTSASQSDYEEIVGAVQSGYYIKDAMANNNEDLLYMTVLISICAPTLAELNMKRRQMKDYLRSQDIETNETTFEQEQCLKSAMPFLALDKKIARKSKRNVLTSSAAAGYMFTAFEMCDDNGVLLGINQQNSSLCIVDIFNSKMYKNANMTIIGTSGAGKTFTMQMMALRMRMRGIQCFILAPLKGHEFRRACLNVGGSYVKLAPGSKHCINIMAIRPRDISSDVAIEGEGAIEEVSLLAEKTDSLSTFFSLMFPNMTDDEEMLLEEAVQETYMRKGITNDNASLYDEQGNLKPMPVLGDLYSILSTSEDTRRLATGLQKFVNGSAASFNQQTNVDLDNKYIVMDISELRNKMLPIGMFIALDYCWDKIKEDRTRKKAIFIDETWQLIGESSNSYAAAFVLEIFKIIRGYGGAAIAATQDLSDFFALEDGKYGRGIINNSKTKIILNLEQDEVDTVKDVLNLSRTETRNILQFERGQALISTNSNKIAVSMRPSDTEKALITTDRAELEAQKKYRQKASGR